ncbi:MAG: hypothetical protein WCK49_06025 [Myxococcaceae bacterium]
MDLKERFTNAMSKNRLAHALLFLGDNPALKEQTALSLTSGLLCENKVIPFGCGSCISCKQVLENRHPRVRMLLGDPEIKIDAIRDLISAPGHPSWIIPKAHLMNKQASNALLKTLEEPRGNQFLILMAPNTRSLLPTLVSRCQRIIFKSSSISIDNFLAPSIPENLSERLELIERLSKDKSDLNQILLAWQQNASSEFKQSLLKAQEDLKKHVNAQLILEGLLLSKKT